MVTTPFINDLGRKSNYDNNSDDNNINNEYYHFFYYTTRRRGVGQHNENIDQRWKKQITNLWINRWINVNEK